MCCKHVAISIILLCCVVPLNAVPVDGSDMGPQIIWVSDGKTPASEAAQGQAVDPNLLDPNNADPNRPWDQDWVDLLRAQGYDVDYEQGEPGVGPWEDSLSEERITRLNKADLVIISRNTGSGRYKDLDTWNAIEAPLFTLNSYFARSNRWKMFDTKALTGDGPSPLVDTMTQTDLAIYDLNVGRPIVSINQAYNAGNGSVLATVDSDFPALDPDDPLSEGIDGFAGSIVLAQWDAGMPYYEGGPTPAGSRAVFAAGTREGAGDYYYGSGVFNLTLTGEWMFLDAISGLLE